MYRLSSAVLVVIFLLAVAALPAHSFVYTAQELYAQDLNEEMARLDDFSDPPVEKGMGWELYRRTAYLPMFTAELIRDEHWLKVVAFERDTSTILPILSAQMYMLYSSAMHRYLQQPEASEMSRIYQQLPGPGIPLMLKLLFPGYIEQDSIPGLLPGKTFGPPPGRAIGILGWLFEEEGVFSGNEWDWNNFLPRILSVTALVVVGLLFIEFLRFLVLLGIRSISQADRRHL